MKLHRADTVADWDKTPKERQDMWQRYARITHGALTPGNLLSGLGLALVLWGLVLLMDGHSVAGLVTIGFGRLADILDGLAAERTGTKSPLGELVDTSFDKIGVLLTVLVFVVYGYAPWWVVVAIALEHVAIILASLMARLRRIALHPSRAGKLAMAGVWTALLFFGVAHICELHDWTVAAWILLAASYCMAVATLGLGLAAATSYYRQILAAKSSGEER